MSGFHGYKDKAALGVRNLQRANAQTSIYRAEEMCFVSVMAIPPQVKANVTPGK